VEIGQALLVGLLHISIALYHLVGVVRQAVTVQMMVAHTTGVALIKVAPAVVVALLLRVLTQLVLLALAALL
jgi:hypothetical protein